MQNHPAQPENSPSLEAADRLPASLALELDALIDSGFAQVSEDSSAASQRPERQKLRHLLSLLDCRPASATGPSSDRETLINLTIAQVLNDHQLRLPEPRLSPVDEEALQSLVMAGFDPKSVPSVFARSAQQHRRLADLVTSGSEAHAEGRASRIAAVMERVEAAAPAPIPFERFSRPSSPRWADIGSVAAVLLIAAGVLWPALSEAREQARRVACESNFSQTAASMAVYAGSNRDEMPMITAGFGYSGRDRDPEAGQRWWEVGNRRGTSNSANLYTLARTGYADLNRLACPGNPHAPHQLPADAVDWQNINQVSYSYQIMSGPKRPDWNNLGRVAVLADRSPVVLRAVRGEIIQPWENSPNHHGRGQGVLFTDGSAIWLKTPELDNGDNIWLPKGLEAVLGMVSGRELRLEGTEFPSGAADAFLGP